MKNYNYRNYGITLRQFSACIVILFLLSVQGNAAGTNDASVDKTGDDVKTDALIRELESNQVALDASLREVERLKGLVQRILEANSEEQFVMYYNMGCIYKANGQYFKAEEQFLKAVEKDPSDQDICYNLGILYDDDLKNPKKARKYYEQFLLLAPPSKDTAQVREWLLSLGD